MQNKLNSEANTSSIEEEEIIVKVSECMQVLSPYLVKLSCCLAFNLRACLHQSFVHFYFYVVAVFF